MWSVGMLTSCQCWRTTCSSLHVATWSRGWLVFTASGMSCLSCRSSCTHCVCCWRRASLTADLSCLSDLFWWWDSVHFIRIVSTTSAGDYCLSLLSDYWHLSSVTLEWLLHSCQCQSAGVNSELCCVCCRMSTPAHASIFAAGMLYTLICFYTVLTPSILALWTLLWLERTVIWCAQQKETSWDWSEEYLKIICCCKCTLRNLERETVAE